MMPRQTEAVVSRWEMILMWSSGGRERKSRGIALCSMVECECEWNV